MVCSTNTGSRKAMGHQKTAFDPQHLKSQATHNLETSAVPFC